MTAPLVRQARGPLGTVITLLALASLIILWYSNGLYDWMWYWIFAIGGLLVQIVVLWGAWYVRRQERRAPGGISAPGQVSIRSLRRGALAGDDGLAPPITIPGSTAAAPQPDAGATSFRVATPESRLLRGQQILYGVGLIANVAIAVMWTLFLIVQRTLSIPPVAPWQLIVLYAWLAILYGLRFVTITRKARTISVEVRADGLHWRTHTLPWSEVRGWSIFAMNPVRISNPRPNIIYAIIGEHASLTWLTYPPFTRTGEPGQQLAQLVHAHMTLPLRDLNPGALSISYAVPGMSTWRRALALAISDLRTGEGILLRFPVAMLTFALSVLVLLGGILTPPAQQWYFGGQLTRLETSTAHISDPLTANTLQWAPTSPDAGKGFAFTPQGYVYLSTTCCDASSLIAQPMNNGLVEVTVRQQVDFKLNEVGILFRANSDSNTMLAFTITPSGEWNLNLLPIQGDGPESDYRLLRNEGILGGIAAIHQGLDATNRLAVLMQGSTFTFFVNGQYIGKYQSNDVPQSGQVGVYAGDMSGPITFSDLLISPA